MNKIWQDNAWEEYLYWQKQDKKTLKMINQIIKDIERDNFNGLGKPEALSGNLASFWSRRIDSKNRIVYRIKDNQIEIAQCGSHYRDK